MPILKSCCFWNNVRKGSYASAIYTLVYFICCCYVLVSYLIEEASYLRGETEIPSGESFLEQGNISPSTVIFNIIFLCCSTMLVLSSLLAIAALRTDQRLLLIPWIVFMIVYILFEFSHLIYWFVSQSVIFDPIVGFLFTLDFFIMCLNLYCLICVTSQYQEYLHGRGLRPNDLNNILRPHVSRSASLAAVGRTTTACSTKSYRPSHHTTTTIANNFTANFKASKISTIPEETTKNHLECMVEKDELSTFEDLSSRSGKPMQPEISRHQNNIPIIAKETGVSDKSIKDV